MQSNNPQAIFELATACHFQGKLDEALTYYRQAIELKMDFAEAHNNLAAILERQGKLVEAIEAYQVAATLKPEFAEAHNNLGNALLNGGQFFEAANSFRGAIAAKPEYYETWSNLGVALQHLGNLDEAVGCHRRAIAIQPHSFAAHNNLACVLKEMEKWQEAEESCRQSRELCPESAEAHDNLGIVLREVGKVEEATECFRAAVRLNPHFAQAHVNLAMQLLIAGEFVQGWQEYEWRQEVAGIQSNKFPLPQWNGEPIEERILLIHAEMGLGDTFQFCRYIPLVKKLGATTVVQCQPSLFRLLSSCPGIDRLISAGDEIPPFEMHVPLLSLPRVFQSTLSTIPASIPYVFADANLIANWGQSLKNTQGFRIGINWHGHQSRGNDAKRRDIPLSQFKSLAELPGVRLISLQKESDSGRANDGSVGSIEPHPQIISFHDIDTANGAFMDTAAIMKNLNLVITSDTAIAHLAGALGVPVWLALPFVPDWRWLLDRSDSPWYPTMRLFRQKSPGDWTSVFTEITAALRERLPLV